MTPHIRVRSATAWLAASVAEHLERAGVGTVEIRVAPAMQCAIRHRRELPIRKLLDLLDLLGPFDPSTEVDGELGEDVDIELSLGDEQPLQRWNVGLYADSPSLLTRVERDAKRAGLRVDHARMRMPEANELRYGGARPFARQIVRWLAQLEGIELTERCAWDDSDEDLHVYLCDPALAGTPRKERFAFELVADDVALAERVADDLRGGGFRVASITSLATAEGAVSLEPGPLGNPARSLHKEAVTRLTESLAALGVDARRYPLRTDTAATTASVARVVLPLAAAIAGTLRPYGGPHPERFEIVLLTDDGPRAEAITRGLEALGYDRITTAPLPSGCLGPEVEWNGLAGEPKLRDAVRTVLSESGVPSLPALAEADGRRDGQRVVVRLPGAATPADRAGLMAALGKCNVIIQTAPGTDCTALRAALAAAGFTRVQDTRGPRKAPATARHGGTSPTVLRLLREALEHATGTAVVMDRVWSDDDDDVVITGLPLPSANSPETINRALPRETRAARQEPVDSGRSFLETGDDDRVRVGETVLLRRGGVRSPLCPELASFASFCLDDTTAATLQHLALGVALREPCLLEGETSTSKTASILYLAALLGMPVVRLSLNGQTDTGELVGRFQPETASPAEGQPARTWRWTDGAVVQAMRQGHWLILDEANLAEPQILERLNALLERAPSFVLSEHDNHVFGPGGEPIHPDFRVFATMNPGDYAGRSPLSPAFRDRWRGYRFVPSPTEDDFVAMLELLATGRQPTVLLDGLRYERAMAEATHPALATLPDPTEQLLALARLHVCAERAAAESGDRRGERRVFTRRALLSVADLVAAMPFGEGERAADRALRVAVQRYYVGSAGSEDLRAALAALVEAGGLGLATGQGAGACDTKNGAAAAEEPAEEGGLEKLLTGFLAATAET